MLAWLFLLGSVWGAWFTWNAHRPIFDKPRMSVLGFFAGWLTKELAFHHLLWQTLVTAAFVWLGVLETWPGKLGLVITLVSWAGLAMLIARAREADGVVERALADGLGLDYEGRIPARYRPFVSREVDWGKVALPFPIRDPAVVCQRNIRYRRVNGINLKLDVYSHAARPERCPTLLYVHGGGWMIGKKDEQGLPLINRLASHGWVCFNVDYRLSPHATLPDPVVDIKHAIAWIREHGHEYGADTDFLVITGGSAGGHLAALTALTANDPRFQPGLENADTSVSGCIPFYGIYDLVAHADVWHHDGLTKLLEKQVIKASLEEDREAYELSSPRWHVSERAPPFFVIHGEHDTLVPVAEARNFVRALAERSAQPVVYAEIPHAQHAFEIFPSLRTTYVLNGVERFLLHLYARYLEARGVEVVAADAA